MRTTLLLLCLSPALFAGEKALFNGKDLDGWEGQPGFWTVEDGAITGRATTEHPVKENTFLIWKGGEVADFELTFQYRVLDKDSSSKGFGNSGVQYRSKVVKPEYSVVAGYQADIETGPTYSGILYEEKGRGILAQRGQKVIIREGESPAKPKIEVTGELEKSTDIQAAIKPADWNEYRIVAQGGHLQHFINGHQTVEVTDETKTGAKSGVLAIQLHAGEPMTVQVKEIVLRNEQIPAKNASLIPVKDLSKNSVFRERLRILSDLDGDGVDDMLLEDTEGHGQMGKSWTVFLNRCEEFKSIGGIVAHTQAISIEAARERFRKDPTDLMHARIWVYLRSSGSNGGFGYFRVGETSVSQLESIEIYPGDGGTDLGRAVYDAAFKKSPIPFRIEKSSTSSDGSVHWTAAS